MKCTTQPDKNKLIMPNAGQTVLDYRVMFCDLVDIRVKDIVTILSAPTSANVGNKYLVVQVNDYSVAGAEHLEVLLQGGVA